MPLSFSWCFLLIYNTILMCSLIFSWINLVDSIISNVSNCCFRWWFAMIAHQSTCTFISSSLVTHICRYHDDRIVIHCGHHIMKYCRQEILELYTCKLHLEIQKLLSVNPRISVLQPSPVQSGIWQQLQVFLKYIHDNDF